MRQIKIVLCQTQIVWEDKAANYRKAEELLAEAAKEGAELVLFPEMSFTGFSMHTEATGETDLATQTYVAQLARRYGTAVGFGWAKACGKKAENHYTIIDQQGNVISDYVKIHPFSFSGEDEKFQGGQEIVTFTLNDIVFSNFICYDLRFPEIFQAASKRADVILVPANWPARRAEHWKTLLRARAIENQVYILAVNCVGEIGRTSYQGDSCVIHPNGDVLRELSGTEGIVTYELADDVAEVREHFRVKQDRREDLYCKWMQER